MIKITQRRSILRNDMRMGTQEGTNNQGIKLILGPSLVSDGMERLPSMAVKTHSGVIGALRSWFVI